MRAGWIQRSAATVTADRWFVRPPSSKPESHSIDVLRVCKDWSLIGVDRPQPFMRGLGMRNLPESTLIGPALRGLQHLQETLDHAVVSECCES